MASPKDRSRSRYTAVRDGFLAGGGDGAQSLSRNWESRVPSPECGLRTRDSRRSPQGDAGPVWADRQLVRGFHAVGEGIGDEVLMHQLLGKLLEAGDDA